MRRAQRTQVVFGHAQSFCGMHLQDRDPLVRARLWQQPLHTTA
jgi:hypothetical protein